MSEQLLECLQVSFARHGMESGRSGNVVRVQDGLVIEPRVFPRNAVGGTAQVQVDFAGVRSMPAGPHWMRVGHPTANTWEARCWSTAKCGRQARRFSIRTSSPVRPDMRRFATCSSRCQQMPDPKNGC